MTAFPANPYFCLKPGKHDITLTSLMANVSEPTSFFVGMCQIDGLEGTENLAMIGTLVTSGDIAEKREGVKNTPPLSIAC